MSSNTSSTYRDRIQALQNEADRLYNQIGGLRDFATGTEKDPLNNCRGLLSQVYSELGKLDNQLSRKRADTIY